MKSLLGIILLLGFGCNIAEGQYTVTVNQQGNGNKVSVTQSDSNNSTGKNTDRNCDDAFRKFAQNSQTQNEILVKKTGSRPDTLLNVAGINRNIVSKKVGQGELDASQYGRSNGLFIIVPDSQGNYHQFNSTQKGESNRVSARLNNAARDLSLSQNGTGNKIAINPCKGKKREKHSHHNSTEVTQNGSNNSVSINQH